MSNTHKTIAGVLAVCALLGGLAFFGLTPFGKAVEQAAQQFGSTVQDNTPWFSNGYKVGNSNALLNASSITIAAGTDQAVWLNTTGQPVIIDMTHAVINATSSNAIASSTFQISVGATSTATIPEPLKTGWIVGSNTSLAIDKFNIATGTQISTGVSGGPFWRLVTDNDWFHSSTTPSEITVLNGQYFFAKLDSPCSTEGSCEQATSTARGFVSISVPFWYHFSSPN